MSVNIQSVPISEELQGFFEDFWDRICENRNEVLGLVEDLIQYEYGVNGLLCGGYRKDKQCFEFRFDPDSLHYYCRFSVTEREIAGIANRKIVEISAEVFTKEVPAERTPPASKTIVRRKAK